MGKRQAHILVLLLLLVCFFFLKSKQNIHTCINIYIVKGSMKRKKLVKGIGSDRKVRSDKICQDLQIVRGSKEKEGEQ